jgi:hypothetical protein
MGSTLFKIFIPAVLLYVQGFAQIMKDVPPLPDPVNTVQVSTAQELASAINNAEAGQTILLEDGTYDVGDYEPLRMRSNSVSLRGMSGAPTLAVLRGRGFGSSSRGEEMITLEASDITIADLTISEVRGNGLKIQTGGNDNLLVHNVHFIDICERSIKGPFVDYSYNGTVRYCLFEQKTPITEAIPNLQFDGDYIAGMDMMTIDGWHIHDNTFKNIRGMNGGARGAIFIWVSSRNVITERNTFIGCDRSIAYGNPFQNSDPPYNAVFHVQNGIIRNNFIVRGSGIGMEICWSEGIKIYHNTMYSTDPTYSRTVFLYENFEGNEIKNNIIFGRFNINSGSSPDTSNNIWMSNSGDENTDWFVNPADADLHLTDQAAEAIDAGIPLDSVSLDWDGAPRSGPPDIGADEFSSGAAVSSSPSSASFRIYPNPYHSGIMINYELGESLPVQLSICSQQGKLVRILVDERKASGKHTVHWNGMDRYGRATGSGMYILRLLDKDKVLKQKAFCLFN